MKHAGAGKDRVARQHGQASLDVRRQTGQGGDKLGTAVGQHVRENPVPVSRSQRRAVQNPLRPPLPAILAPCRGRRRPRPVCTPTASTTVWPYRPSTSQRSARARAKLLPSGPSTPVTSNRSTFGLLAGGECFNRATPRCYRHARWLSLGRRRIVAIPAGTTNPSRTVANTVANTVVLARCPSSRRQGFCLDAVWRSVLDSAPHCPMGATTSPNDLCHKGLQAVPCSRL